MIRTALAGFLLERARGRSGAAAERWLRLASAVSPRFGPAQRELIEARSQAGDLPGAVSVARRCVDRFPRSADAWMALGGAHRAAFRPHDALVAFEQALQLEERADAAMAAGEIYRRHGDHVTAGARFARAYAASGNPDALEANAHCLRAAGDVAASQEAMELWKKVTGR